jgi:HlyD family secretion protein
MKRKTWLVLTAVAVVVIVVVAMTVPSPALDVDTAAITRGRLEVTVDEEGRTRVRDRFVVAAPVAGRVGRLTLKRGDRISAGEVLASIAPSPQDPRAVEVLRGQLAAAEARRLQAEAQVGEATARVAQATRDLERAKALSEADALSRNDFEQSLLASTSAQRQLEMRRAALRAADAEVAGARASLIGSGPGASGVAAVAVRAPTGGRVLRVVQESARVVTAGTPLVEIGDASGMEVVVDVISEQAVRIAPGAPVAIDRWGGDSVLRGHVRLIEPEAFTKVSALGVEEQRVNVIIDLHDPPPALGAGYRVEARITSWSGDDVVMVPTSALFREEGGWAVFAVNDGRASRRTLQIGHRSLDMAEVIDGLAPGDTVILYPSPAIADGLRVK